MSKKIITEKRIINDLIENYGSIKLTELKALADEWIKISDIDPEARLEYEYIPSEGYYPSESTWTIIYNRLETDKEEERRLKKRKKEREIKKKVFQQRAKKKEDKEREEYLRLKEKYGDK